jgi:DNA repair protein RecO (recombination protein O)
MQSVRGIVLNTFRFAEKKIIAKVYSKNLGLLSLLLHFASTKNSSYKPAFFLPFTEIDFQIQLSSNKTLHHPSEINLVQSFSEAFSHPLKNSQLIFLNEVLIKCLKEEHANNDLYDFVIAFLDQISTQNFNPDLHLLFLLEFTSYLGFYPHLENTNTGIYFDLLEGVFVNNPTPHPNYCDRESTETFKNFILNYDKLKTGKILSSTERKQLLNLFKLFYFLHVPGLHELKSIAVLEQLSS